MAETVLFLDRYEIRPRVRLPRFDAPGVEAFAVSDRSHPERDLFALIAPADLPCRALAVCGLTLPQATPLLWPEASGLTDWPVLAGPGTDGFWGRRPAIIFRAPRGDRFLLDLTAPQPPVSPPVLTRMLIAPAIAALRALHGAGLTHRAIRADNLFRSVDHPDASLLLGECLSMPPGFGQPPIYETIENIGTDPLARGPGTIADDLYSIGVLAALMMAGSDPTWGWTSEQIANAKINQGSFALLAGREKLSASMAELLRGLLADQPELRWSISQVETWLKGQQNVPALAGTQQRANRPIQFCGNPHVSKVSLSHAMALHWPKALSFVDSADLGNWLRRGFGEETAVEELNQLRSRSRASGSGTAARDRFLSRVCIKLDPNGPLRYRDIRAQLPGLGTLMSRAIKDGELSLQLGDMLRGRLHFSWLENQPAERPDLAHVRKTFENLDRLIDRPGPGFGIERVLYELQSDAPCRSPLIADYYVTNASDLLPALDAVAPDLAPGSLPIDRHIAAFIGARLMRSVDRELGLLYVEKEEAAQAVAHLRLIATVQDVHPDSDLHRLMALMISALQPALGQFRNRGTRDAIGRQLERYASACDFGGLAGLFEPDGEMRMMDKADFKAAQRSYLEARNYASWLEAGGLINPQRVRQVGAQLAAGSFAFLASAAVTFYCLMSIW